MTEKAIEIRLDNLPTKPEELKKFILIGRDIVQAHKLKIKAIKDVGDAATAHKAALEDGQTVAEVVLDAEAKLGEMLAARPAKRGRTKEYGSKGGTIPDLPSGIDKKMSHKAQQIHKHPDVVDKCKKKCREKGELVTSQCVLREVRKTNQQRQSKDRKKASRKPKGYYLTEGRLSFLREKVKHILKLLDVPVITLCPITLVVAELHSIEAELMKLQPYKHKRSQQARKGQ